MKKHKILALALALSMTLGLCGTSSAAGTDQGTVDGKVNVVQSNKGSNATITVETILVVPTIDVIVGNPYNFVVNPYGMKFTYDGAEKTDTLWTGNPTLITNKSNIGLKVTASPIARAGDSVKFVDSSTAGTNPSEPTVFMYLQMAPTTSVYTTGSDTKVFKSDNGSGTPFVWSNYSVGGNGIAVVKKEATATGLKMKAADSNTAPEYGVMRFAGDSAGSGWDATSCTINLTITFTFTPDASIDASAATTGTVPSAA